MALMSQLHLLQVVAGKTSQGLQEAACTAPDALLYTLYSTGDPLPHVGETSPKTTTGTTLSSCLRMQCLAVGTCATVLKLAICLQSTIHSPVTCCFWKHGVLA